MDRMLVRELRGGGGFPAEARLWSARDEMRSDVRALGRTHPFRVLELCLVTLTPTKLLRAHSCLV